MSESERHTIYDFLRAEIIGPRNEGLEIDTSVSIIFNSREESVGPWVSLATGQEILTIRPRDRYGSGVLEPVRSFVSSVSESLDRGMLDESLAILEPTDMDVPNIGETETLEARSPRGSEDSGEHLDLEVKSNRAWLNPRTVGMSFSIVLNDGDSLNARVLGATYRPLSVTIKDKAKKLTQEDSQSDDAETIVPLTLVEKVYETTWYERVPFELDLEFAGDLFSHITDREIIEPVATLTTGRVLNIKASLLVRKLGQNEYLCTLSCVNRSTFGVEENVLYQTEVQLEGKRSAAFKPYPQAAHDYQMDLDDESALLLYSKYPTFAIGHNAGVEWERDVSEGVTRLTLTSMPTFEAPSITPDFEYPDGKKAVVDMRILADEAQKATAVNELKLLVQAYEHWIVAQEQIARTDATISSNYSRAAGANLSDCRSAVSRMHSGIELLINDALIYEAFRIANLAMLRQQYRSRLPLREISYEGRITVGGDFPSTIVPAAVGIWRPFQIAFFLSVLESVSNPKSRDRDLVDLIFFPTGGGKTEAYLGVTAFVAVLRRLRKRDDSGTAVLMRYTLRLLTTQQFLRAASLVCALEDIRREDPDRYGGEEFSIGAWLGSAVTPNSHQKALSALKELRKRGDSAGNPFLLLKCPWCGTQLGPVRSSDTRNAEYFLAGYKEVTTSPREFRFHCPDVRCEFSSGLPLTVIDEDIYRNPPTLLIGTVDKFAQLAWQEAARGIFGLDESGDQKNSPPELIIQDEFHLIAGPLGSMVGMYEGVIESLCTQLVDDEMCLPKIISSTATIRRFRAQAHAIYGRSRVALFPPPCLDASDSFFAVWARDSGKLLNGRLYVGVNAPGLGSVQSAQVRVGASLAQAPMAIDSDECRDPWWTNLWFFNSIRELSNTVSLFQSDIPNYLLDMKRRYSLVARHLNTINELTSRRQSYEIPKVLQELERNYKGISNPKQKGIWDACLASNIIEVGIDIERLSLMTIVSQPKSTAQYIQVSGRVGRNWSIKPGLVVTIYTSNRPRDLSHFEHFRSYHEKLYAQVEPTSVTPFSAPVIRRALRGAVVSYLRMKAPFGTPPKNVDRRLLEFILSHIRMRAEGLGTTGGDLAYLDAEILRITNEWDVYKGDDWGTQDGSPNGILVGPTEDKSILGFRWIIPVSMRNVDSSVELEISRKYRDAQLEELDS